MKLQTGTSANTARLVAVRASKLHPTVSWTVAAPHASSFSRWTRAQPMLCKAVPTSDKDSVASLTPPISTYDVDLELWQVLDLCSDEELEGLYNILHGPSPFSPLVKSLVTVKEPALVEVRGRSSIMHKLESRFRFLAADSASFLQGRRPGYREILLQIRTRWDPCSAASRSVHTSEMFEHACKACASGSASEQHDDLQLKTRPAKTLSW